MAHRLPERAAAVSAPALGVVARPAATIVLLRDGEDGLEVHMQRRSPALAVAARAWVFPGGAMDEADLSDASLGLCDRGALLRLAARMRLDADGEGQRTSAGLAACAVRELFEEAAVLLVRDGADRAPAPDASEPAGTSAAGRPARRGRVDGPVAAARERVLRGAELAAELVTLGLRYDLDRLVYIAHFVTPEGMPRRHDTRFFAVAARPGEEPEHHGAEATLGAWCRPAQMLARASAGEVEILPPTRILLGELGRHARTGDALAELGAREVATVCFDLARLAGLRLPDHLPTVEEVAAASALRGSA